MSLLLPPGGLTARRAISTTSLSALTASLAHDLEPLLDREIHFPREKALLSREGGRCVRDGTLLDFDPFERHAHRCPRCGAVYRGEHHDRFWIYWYQLWLAERAVHGAVLAALGAGDRFAGLARSILDGYAERYLDYPNVDNVLGPSRLFFSTYLESIWLLQICIATDLLDDRDPSLSQRVRDRIVEPARSIIADFDEGASNRQVWNDVALLAAARVLEDDASAERAVFGRSGITSLLAGGLLHDGSWYEGENYHLFAHRGLWFGVTLAEQAGFDLPPVLLERFQSGFSAPFATALPDFTLPSRRDSPYAVSLRQWRIAEHCELGVARRADPVLLGALQRMYAPGAERGATGRDRSSAEVERNAQPSALSRADLSWRALLCALPDLPDSSEVALPSVLLDGQGIAVFRRDEGRSYVALDYGHSGGGHGHPDRLNLLIADGNTRWLDDFGTGSYTDRSLHWYRSTLAHNAPLVDGRSQMPAHGQLAAYDETDPIGWVVGAVEDPRTGVALARTIVVMPTYVVDCLSWQGARPVTIDLPLHADIRLDSDDALSDATLTGGSGIEDGFEFLEDTRVVTIDQATPVRGMAVRDGATLDVFADSSCDVDWWRATAPGAPGTGPHRFRILRSQAAEGEHRVVWSWRSGVTAVEWGEAIRVTMSDGAIHIHTPTEDGWRVEMLSGGRARIAQLGGLVLAPQEEGLAPSGNTVGATPTTLDVPSNGETLNLELGESHYRRSEVTWAAAGAPVARVALSVRDRGLEIVIDLPRSDRTFVPRDAVNAYDNEPAVINGDGVELFLSTDAGLGARLLVPDVAGGSVHSWSIDGWPAPVELDARWEPTTTGYRMFIRIADLPRALDLIVNEKPIGRVRRRGQLVLSGARGEFVYLRGDRHDADHLISIRYT